MSEGVPGREEAFSLLKEYNQNEGLIRHALAVEGVMRYCAAKRGEGAVVSHGWGICTDVEPRSELEKVLYAIDELTGLVAATALVRPSKSVLDVKVKSVKKKWKDKAFAAGVNREVIARGAEMLGIEVSEFIEDTIMGMRQVAEEIGLLGDAEVS